MGPGSRSLRSLVRDDVREGVTRRFIVGERRIPGERRITLFANPPYATALRTGLIALAQEYVIRGIGDAAEGAGLLARALRRSAAGVEALDGRHVGEGAFALTFRHVELQQGDVVRRRASRTDGNLAPHGAFVGELPV